MALSVNVKLAFDHAVRHMTYFPFGEESKDRWACDIFLSWGILCYFCPYEVIFLLATLYNDWDFFTP